MESWNDDPQQGDNEKKSQNWMMGQIESGFPCKDWVEQC